MKLKIAVIASLFMLCTLCVFGQTSTSDTTSSGPTYSAGAFLGFNHYDSPQIKGGGFFDTKVAENTYSTTALNMTSKLATVTTGVKRFFYASPGGTVGLYGNAAAGVATGDGSTTATFAGGGGVKVMLSGAAGKFAFLKPLAGVPNSYLSGGVNIQQVNGVGVLPTFTFALGVDFR